MSKDLPLLGASALGHGRREATAGSTVIDAPVVPLTALDQLWFQVAGTVCNLRCSHCFISCSPENHSHWFLGRAEVREHLAASARLGVKEYYFTGGEPFMNREMTGILDDTLAIGPATVLTNATLLPQRTVDELARIAGGSMYTLELRVSIDGTTREMNDALRGEGAFERAMAGMERLVAAGFLPIVTAMQTWQDPETPEVLAAFRELLAGIGYVRARVKILPRLRIGAEQERAGGYCETDRVTAEMMVSYDADLLLCARARLVTARGIWVCPILLDSESGRLGETLQEAVAAPALLSEQACYTCYVSGAICSNTPGYTKDFS
ncbi:MAG: radical SAM protein [Gemmatimonadetes bacterium]|nr:radical SAM protein [Gemmatimonadota bacterium]